MLDLTRFTGFTPGPWRIGSRCENDNTLEIVTDTKESPLAYISPRPHYDDTQTANARLISHAPALLKECKRLREALEAIDAGFKDGSIRWRKSRQADSDPYHPANTLLCKALYGDGYFTN